MALLRNIKYNNANNKVKDKEYMLSVLLVNNENIDKSYLSQTLGQFTDVSITESKSADDALELFSKRYFEILFLDSSVESIDHIEKFKNNNPDIIIIIVYKEENQAIRDSIMQVGVHDCIRNTTDKKILAQRVSNYIDLSRLKKEELFNSDAINLFDKDINSHYLAFKLNSKETIEQFLNYFSSSYFQRFENINKSIDLLYAFASWMVLNHRECEVIKETGENNMYLTLEPIDYMSDEIVSNLIAKHAQQINYKISKHKLSLKIVNLPEQETASNTSGIDDETKSILAKTHFDKITAVEFVESTVIEFVDKLENLSELEDQIDETIVNFENNPTTETLAILSQDILEYVDIIELLVDFQHLSYALKTLANSITSITQEQLQDKEVRKFTTLMLSLLNDLSSWRDNIFVKQEANDIHYLDSSLLSSCLQIESIFNTAKIDEDEDDFELF